MGKTLSEIAQQLQDSEKKVQLIYAFNGVGKTRLSREFKELISPKTESEEDGDSKNKVLYYNAFTEDLFYWDNDLENDVNRKLVIQPNSFTDWILKEEGKEGDIVAHFAHYTNSKTTPQYSPDFSEVTFYVPGQSDPETNKIKISKGEESNFIWCVFYSMLESVIGELNEPQDNRSTNRFDELKYIFIDDPVSSLDENHLIELAVDLANLVKGSKSELKFIITTHSPLFYNVLCSELSIKDETSGYRPRQMKKSMLKKTDNGEFDFDDLDSDVPFSYHLFLLSELNDAINNDCIQKYHFNSLRNILEKTSSFLGYHNWGILLDECNREYQSRMINLCSHSKISWEEVPFVKAEEKAMLFDIINFLRETYHFKIKPNLNVVTTPPPPTKD